MSRFSVFEDEEWKQKRKELEAQVAKEKGEILVRTKDGEEYMSPELYNKLVSLGQPVFKVPEQGINVEKVKHIKNPYNKERDVTGGMKYKKPFTDYLLEELTDVFRIPALAAQGFNNSYLNPVGLAQRLYNYSQGNGFETSFDYIQPENTLERVAEAVGSSVSDFGYGRALSMGINSLPVLQKGLTSANKFIRYPSKVINWMASPGAAWTEFGATVGGNVLPAIVNLEYPGEEAPLSEKALYYTLSTGLPIAGSLIGMGVANPKAVIKTGTDVSKNIGTKIIKKGKEILENGIDKARYNMEVFKIKKAYDELLSNPLKGVGTDTIVKIKPRNSEPINLLRGEAIKDEFGNVIAHGRRLKKATGTERNFGLNKIIYKHHIPKEDVIEIPKILRNNTSPKVMESGKIHYIFKNKNGETELMVISPFNSEKNIVTLRKLEE